MCGNKLSFVIPVTREDVLERNVLRSKVFKDNKHEFIFQRGYNNVPKACNEALEKAKGDILVFSHQDVFFSEHWEGDFQSSLRGITALDPDWGVLGIAGVQPTKRLFGLLQGAVQIGNYSTNVAGGAYVIDHHYPKEYPQEVSSLDECVIVAQKKNAGFDEHIPNNHFYGVDLILRCRRKGLKSYAISAYAHHDSDHVWPEQDFYAAAEYIFHKHRDLLPICTNSVIIEEVRGRPRFRTDLLALIPYTMRSFLKWPKRVGRRRRPT